MLRRRGQREIAEQQGAAFIDDLGVGDGDASDQAGELAKLPVDRGHRGVIQPRQRSESECPGRGRHANLRVDHDDPAQRQPAVPDKCMVAYDDVDAVGGDQFAPGVPHARTLEHQVEMHAEAQATVGRDDLVAGALLNMAQDRFDQAPLVAEDCRG